MYLIKTYTYIRLYHTYFIPFTLNLSKARWSSSCIAKKMWQDLPTTVIVNMHIKMCSNHTQNSCQWVYACLLIDVIWVYDAIDAFTECVSVLPCLVLPALKLFFSTEEHVLKIQRMLHEWACTCGCCYRQPCAADTAFSLALGCRSEMSCSALHSDFSLPNRNFAHRKSNEQVCRCLPHSCAARTHCDKWKVTKSHKCMSRFWQWHKVLKHVWALLGHACSPNVCVVLGTFRI